MINNWGVVFKAQNDFSKEVSYVDITLLLSKNSSKVISLVKMQFLLLSDFWLVWDEIAVIFSFTGSIPRFTLLSHSLVCIETYLFNVWIGPIHDKELICIFQPVSFFPRWMEDRYKCYKINIRYTSIFKFYYNDIWLWFLLCFGANTEKCMLSGIYLFWYTK